MTESSEHNAEYNPYFIPHGRQQVERFAVPIDEYLCRCDRIVDEFERLKCLARSDEKIEVHRSHEYGSSIIHSMFRSYTSCAARFATATERPSSGNFRQQASSI